MVARELGAGLERRPLSYPTDPKVLDRYERLIEALRLAGREQEAFDLYLVGMGGYPNLGWGLGDYQRGYRTLAAFSATGRLEGLGPRLVLRKRSLLASELALFAFQLGRVAEALAIGRMVSGWEDSLGESEAKFLWPLWSHTVAFARGRLAEARLLADTALAKAEKTKEPTELRNSLARRAITNHAVGEIAAARADFASARELEGGPLMSARGYFHARHLLDLGDLAAARYVCDRGWESAFQRGWNDELPWFQALLTRIDLAQGRDTASEYRWGLMFLLPPQPGVAAPVAL